MSNASVAGGIRTSLAEHPVHSAALFALLAGAVGLAAGHGSLTDGAILAGYAALFVPYAVLLVRREGDGLPLWVLIAAAVAVRLAFLPATPILSDDIYRYVWDGRVGTSGVNPFMYAPAAEYLAPLRDAHIWERVNHPEIPTIYPPGAQFLFQGNALLGGSVIGLKGLLLLVEAFCLLGCGWVLVRRTDDGTPWAAEVKRPFLIYALNPLVFVEVAWSGHLDVAAWGLLVFGLAAWCYSSDLRSAVIGALAIGSSIAVKFLGLLALPLLAIENRSKLADALPRRKRLAVLTIAPLVVAVTYLPFLDAGPRLFSGFGEYAEAWRGNDGGYRAVWNVSHDSLEAWSSGDSLFHFATLDGAYQSMGWTKTWKGETLPDTTYATSEVAAVAGKAAALLVVGLAFLWCFASGASAVGGLLLILLALYTFAPIVHPWYVAWLVPLAALHRSRAALVFSFTALAAYLAWLSARAGGPWHVPTWAVTLEYGLVAAVFLHETTTDPQPVAS